MPGTSWLRQLQLENCPGENRGKLCRRTDGPNRTGRTDRQQSKICISGWNIRLYLHDIHQYGQAGCDQHDLRIHLVVAADESSDGQPNEDARDDPDHEDGGHGANNLSPIPAEGHPVKDKSEWSLINVGAGEDNEAAMETSEKFPLATR